MFWNILTLTIWFVLVPWIIAVSLIAYCIMKNTKDADERLTKITDDENRTNS